MYSCIQSYERATSIFFPLGSWLLRLMLSSICPDTFRRQLVAECPHACLRAMLMSPVWITSKLLCPKTMCHFTIIWLMFHVYADYEELQHAHNGLNPMCDHDPFCKWLQRESFFSSNRWHICVLCAIKYAANGWVLFPRWDGSLLHLGN